MPVVDFTPNLSRQTRVESRRVIGTSVREALDALFDEFPAARGYILEDHGAVRRHVAIFIDGANVIDRVSLSDPVDEESMIFVMQALSGG